MEAKMKERLVLLFLLVLTGLTGCGKKDNNPIEAINTIYLPNKVEASSDELEDKDYIKKYNDYALGKAADFFKEDENKAFSPMGIYFPALAYYDIKESDSDGEIEESFSLDQDVKNCYRKVYDDAVYANKKDRSIYKNLLVLDNEKLLDEEVLDRLKKYHVGHLSKVEDKESREGLDEFVARITSERFEKSELSTSKGPLLLSFSDYSSSWKAKKIYERPQGLLFEDGHGEKKTMDSIKGIVKTKYSRDANNTIFEMPLEDGFTMLFAMPNQVEKNMFSDKAYLEEVISIPKSEGHVIFTLPKFKFKESLDLTELYPELELEEVKQYINIGLSKGGIEGYRDLDLKAFKTKEDLEDKVEITVDKPFVYILRTPRGEITSMGVYRY